MFLCCWLALGALIPLTLSTDPGVKVKLTAKGLEYGRTLGMASIQKKLKTIKVPDMAGKESVSPIGTVQYSLTNLQIVEVGLPTSAVALVPGTGVRLSIGKAFLRLHGNWRVKYLRIIKDSGSFDLSVSDLTVAASVAIQSDETGRPAVHAAGCAATVGGASIKFHGGASWLYNLFTKFIEKAIRSALQRQICPLVTDAVSDLNPQLKTLNVIAKVDQYAEIEYSLVSSPAVTTSSIELGLKGEFYNIGKRKEPPFSASAFDLPLQTDNMLYIGLSAFTANSAAFVYSTAGALSLYVTDDMLPKASPFRLNTRTFGVFIPQVAKLFPGLMMKLLVKTAKTPVVTFEPNNTTVQATGAVTAYAIQPNATLSPLFVLNLESSVSAQLSVSATRVAGAVTLNKMDLTLETSYVGEFQVKALSSPFQLVLKAVVIPLLNGQLAKGYPLPTIGKMKLVNTQLQVLKDYMLIGTDVQFK
ncbi:bactericidal permeability-increasing protein-like [Pungitius pungitius]|uniref:bactericidal permeability-increasing protein-like n=1 Tax=Pungitius pungitius TaxID=134920 RepID=UPI001887C298|nr:bactericidal permeability-increasing protein-like [Pungitius pungitius]XP_037347123.1 bactericidal permeability-increasing protein-like [Pungitius pungitius]